MDKETFDSLFVYGITQQRPQDWLWVVDNVETIRPKVIVEIGVRLGGSLRYWEHIVPINGMIIGVDIDVSITETIYYNWNKNNNVKLIIGDSTKQETVEKVKATLRGNEIDFLLIDGGHRDGIPEKDFLGFLPLVKMNGLICIADLGEACATHVFQSLPEPKKPDPTTGMGMWFKTTNYIEIPPCPGRDDAYDKLLKKYRG